MRWVKQVQDLAAKADRQEIADQYIGHILAHAPSDTGDGAWPHVSVRRLIQEIQNDNVERGLIVERHNMRGVYGKNLFEGGKQERDLAKQYRDWARASAQWPRLAHVLEQTARDWDAQGEAEDLRARQDMLRS